MYKTTLSLSCVNSCMAIQLLIKSLTNNLLSIQFKTLVGLLELVRWQRQSAECEEVCARIEANKLAAVRIPTVADV